MMKCAVKLVIFCAALITAQAVPFGPRYANYAQSSYGSNQYGQAPYGGSAYPNYGDNQQTRPGNQGTFGSYNNYQQPYNQYNQTRPGNNGAFGGTGTGQWNSQPTLSSYQTTTWNPIGTPLAQYPGTGIHSTQGTSNYPGGNYPGSSGTYPGGITNYPGSTGNYPGGTNTYPGGSNTYPPRTGSNYPSHGSSPYPTPYNSTYPSRPGGTYPSGSASYQPTAPTYGGSGGYQQQDSRIGTHAGHQSQELSNCINLCQRSQDASPVCGSNRRTYPNLAALQCEQKCGAGVTYNHHGAC